MIIGLLVVSDLRVTWSVNSVDLEFDLDREGIWLSRSDGYLSERLCHMTMLWFVGDEI
jgi:hypothetical protein